MIYLTIILCIILYISYLYSQFATKKDKFLHSIISSIITAICLLLCISFSISPIYAILVTLVIGIAKEIRDYYVKKLFDKFDVFADLTGVVFVSVLFTFLS